MKNKEKFAEQIVDLSINGNCFAVAKNSGEVIECHHCQECLFQDCFHGDCETARNEWAESEFESMWKNVEIDTPILVSNDSVHWYHRHFAYVDDDGVVYAFESGTTSWTCMDENKKASDWKFAKIIDDGEVES